MSKSSLSSLTKKYIMGITGLFLIVFLIVHCGINALIFLDDKGVTFSHVAHFMGSNILMRTMEIGLVIGFLVHIVDGLVLFFQNKSARPVGYAMSAASSNSSWYSRSMALLGTLLLMFLILHASHFWIPNRAQQFASGVEKDLFLEMKTIFTNPIVVIIYVLACISLFWHLFHGFKSAFQSLGLSHSRYNKIIATSGTIYSIIISALFAAMPIAMHFGWIK